MNEQNTIYQDMSLVGFVLVALAQIIEAVVTENLSLEDFYEHRDEIIERCKANSSNPTTEIVVSPIVKVFLKEMEQWLNQKNNWNNIYYFAKVLNGDEVYSEKVEFSAIRSEEIKLKWYSQVIEGSKALIDKIDKIDFKTSRLDEKESNKRASLIRNIPMDVPLGMIAQSFLTELTYPQNIPQAKLYWSYLTGEKPLRYTLKIKGLFAWMEDLS